MSQFSKLMIITSVLAGLTSLVYFYLLDSHSSQEKRSSGQLWNATHTRTLLTSYCLDFPYVDGVRRNNMENYHRKYEPEVVEKRSNLSLQEFSDIYDGKW